MAIWRPYGGRSNEAGSLPLPQHSPPAPLSRVAIGRQRWQQEGTKVFCPSCASEYRPGYTACVDCEVPLVEHLTNAPRRRLVPAFPTIPKLPDNRPLLIKIVPYVAFMIGVEAILGLVVGLLDVGTFTRAERVISGREFLSQAGLPLGALVLVSVAVALAFWKEAPWSRHLLIACITLEQLWSGFGGTDLLEFGPFTLDVGNPSGVVFLAIVCWYLYGKSNVRTYYQALRVNRGGHRPW